MATFGTATFGSATFGNDATVAPSSVLTLRTVWLNDQQDPSDFISFTFMTDLQVSTSLGGEVRSYGGSSSAGTVRPARLRSVLAGGQRRSISVEIQILSREEVAWLEDHAGRVLLVRDDRGRRIWGTYFQVDVTERQFEPGQELEAGASIAISEVTVNEVV